MWFYIAIFVPLSGILALVAAERTRGKTDGEWTALFFIAYFFLLPVVAYGAGVVHLFKKMTALW